MPRPVPVHIATLALACLPLLAGCGGTAATEQPAKSAPAGPAPSSAATPGPASPAATPAPTDDPLQDRKDAAEVTKKFGKALFTFSDQDTSVDDYLERLRPLSTDNGYAQIKKEVTGADFEKVLKEVRTRHERSVVTVEDDVTIVRIDAGSARTRYRYRGTIERRSGGGWTTVRTPSDSGSLDLAKQDGSWLVDDVPRG